MGTTSFRQLDVWKAAHRVSLAVYRLTQAFPVEERYGLTTQMRKAAVSIAANIAEGYGRRGAPDKARFYNMSQGSANELEYYLILAKDLGYLGDAGVVEKDLDSVCRMLRRLTQATLRGS